PHIRTGTARTHTLERGDPRDLQYLGLASGALEYRSRLSMHGPNCQRPLSRPYGNGQYQREFPDRRHGGLRQRGWLYQGPVVLQRVECPALVVGLLDATWRASVI